MPCDETKLNQTSESLSPAQHAVLEAMLAGKTITAAAAAAAGVGRAAVYRWLKNDFLFQAELNRGLGELRQRRRSDGGLGELRQRRRSDVGVRPPFTTI